MEQFSYTSAANGLETGFLSPQNDNGRHRGKGRHSLVASGVGVTLPVPVVRAYKRLSKPRPRFKETLAQAKVRIAGEDHYQTHSCRTLAKLNAPGLKIVWYSDVVSSLEKNRPGRDSMFQDCNPGDILIADSLSRFQRDQYDALRFWDLCEAKHVTFYTRNGLTNEAKNPQSKFVYGILSCVDEYQREEFKDRMAEVQLAARANGKRIGRPRKLTAELAERARALMAEGMTKRATAKKLHIATATFVGGLDKYYPLNGHVDSAPVEEFVIAPKDPTTDEGVAF